MYNIQLFQSTSTVAVAFPQAGATYQAKDHDIGPLAWLMVVHKSFALKLDLKWYLW